VQESPHPPTPSPVRGRGGTRQVYGPLSRARERGGAQRRGEGSPRKLLLLLLFAGLLIRIALIPWGAFGYDVDGMSEWTRQLHAAPLAEFYAAEMMVPPDHLPGDLWVLLGLGWAARLVAPGTDFNGDGYMMALKAVAVVADLLVGMLLHFIARGFVGVRRALLVTAAFVLNPAAIFLSAVWGQWDSVSMALALAALLLTLRGQVGWALPVLAIATLIKPQLILLAPLYVVYAVRRKRPDDLAGVRAWWRGAARTLPTVVGGGVASLVVVVLICLPFDVGLPGMATRWTLLERLQFAAERYPLTTYNAYNLWTLPIGRGEPPADSIEALLGFSAAGVGLVLLLLAYAGALAGAAFLPRAELALLWATLATTLAIFLLPTRVHERYLFPALVFMALLWGVVERRRWAGIGLVGLSATMFANLYFVFAFWKPAIYPEALHTSLTVRAIALVNLGILAAVLLIGLIGVIDASSAVRRR